FICCLLSTPYDVDLLYLLPFPTRRSSDLLPGHPPDDGAWPRRELARPLRWRASSTTTFRNASRPRTGRRSIISISTSPMARSRRSEEHTSELQSRFDLVCRLLLDKKNKHI